MSMFIREYFSQDQVRLAPRRMLEFAAGTAGFVLGAVGVFYLTSGEPIALTLVFVVGALCCIRGLRTAAIAWQAGRGSVTTSGELAAAIDTAITLGVLCVLAAIYLYWTADDKALLQRAARLREFGSPGRAAATATDVIGRDPEALPAYRERALAYQALRRYPESFADRAEVVRLSADEAARIEALEEFLMAVRYCPDPTVRGEAEPAVLDSFIGALLKRHFTDDGAKILEALPRDSGSGLVCVFRGLIRRQFSMPGALDEFDQAIQRNPKQSLAYRAKGYLLASSISRGSRWSSPELGQDGHDFLRARFGDRVFDTADGIGAVSTEAVRVARAGCEASDWKDADCLALLAYAHAKTGDFEEAARWQGKALEFPEYRQRHGAKGTARLEAYRARSDGGYGDDVQLPERPAVRDLLR